MRWVLFVIAAILVVCLQAATLAPLSPTAALVKLPLIFAVYMGLYSVKARGLVACWLLGLLRDLFSPAPLGFFAALYLVVGGAAHVVGKRFHVKALLVQAGVLFFAALLVAAAHLAALDPASGGRIVAVMGERMLLAGGLTAVVGVPVMRLLRKTRFGVGITEKT